MENRSKKSSGVISDSEMYTLEEFKRRLNLTDTAMRALRRKGFQVLRVGKRGFVTGRHAMIFFDNEGTESNESKSDQSPFQVSGSSMGVSSNREGETEISENFGPTES